MAEHNIILKIKNEGARAAIQSCETINKKMERMVSSALKANEAYEKLISTANGLNNVKLLESQTIKNDQKRIIEARKTTQQLEKEYKKRADAEWKELERTANKWQREEEKRIAKEKKNSEMQAKRNAKNKPSRRSYASNLTAGIAGGVMAGATSFGLGLIHGGISEAQQYVIDQAQQNMALDDRLKRLSIQARGTGESGMNPQDLRNKVFEQAKKGKDASEVASGIESIVSRTGDLNLALNALEGMTKLSIATGANMGELGNVVADLSTKFGLTKPEELNEALAILTIQGKRGAFELKDMATELPEIAAAAKAYGLTGIEGLKQVGAISQIARGSTGSAAEASTSSRSLFTDLIKNSDRVKKLSGIDVLDKNNIGKNALTLLPELISKIGGDPKKLFDIFGDRSAKAVMGLTGQYNQTYKSAIDGGKSKDEAKLIATKALETALNNAANAADAAAEVERDYADASQLSSTKIQAAQSAFTEKMAEIDWFPLIEALPNCVSAVELFAKSLSDAVDFIDRITNSQGKRKVERAENDLAKSNANLGGISSKMGLLTARNAQIDEQLSGGNINEQEKKKLLGEKAENDKKLDGMKTQKRIMESQIYTDKSALSSAKNLAKNESETNNRIQNTASDLAVNMATGGLGSIGTALLTALNVNGINQGSGSLIDSLESAAKKIAAIGEKGTE